MHAVNNTRGSEALQADRLVNLLGWGSQNDTNHSQPSSTPMKLIAKTIECPPALNYYEERYGKNLFPFFICVGAPDAVGAPCDGESGGTHEKL